MKGNAMEALLKKRRLVKAFSLGVTIASTIAMGIFMTQVLTDRHEISKAEQQSHEEFFNYLSRGIENYSFNEEFYQIAFNHYDRKYNGQLAEYGYTELLEDFVVFISNISDSASNIDTLKYNTAKQVLKIAQQTEPFSSLPSEERRLMDNIQLFLQSDDIENSLNALNELKQVILVRYREYEKIEKQNSWSTPLAFVGIGFTLVFGIFATIRAFRRIG